MQHAICCTVHRQCLSSDTEMLATLWRRKHSQGLLSGSLSVSGSGNRTGDCFHRTEATYELLRESFFALSDGCRDYKMKTKKKTLDERYDHTHTHAHKHLYTHTYILGIYLYIYVCGPVTLIVIATVHWLGSPEKNSGANEIFVPPDLHWVHPNLL